MGLLDDAIREHLELKRRHGASDEEIAQEEAEALGPARREFPLPAAAEEGQSAEVQSAEAQDAEAEGAVEDPLPEALEDLPTAVEPPPAEPEQEQEQEPGPEPEQAFEPEPRHPPPATRPPDPEEPRQEHDEDVLEETPEFLQDAPEHDRLWFEQKPPRDFDFE